MRAETASISVPPSRALVGVTSPPCEPRLALGVGQVSEREDPFADMGGAHLASLDNAGGGGVSESFEVSEHETKALGAVSEYVLPDNESGAQVGDDACHFGPEPPLIIGAPSMAGG